MSRLSRFHSWHAAAAIVPTLFLAGAANAAPASNDDLQQQISALEEQVRRLEGRQEAPSTELVDRAVADVLRDADRRSQLLDPEPGLTAGYTDGKFIIQSADGAFRLNPSVGFQFRYVANDRKEAKNGTSDDLQSGFEIRRLKFSFNGNMMGDDFYYKFQWSTNRKTGSPELDEGWVRYQIHDTPWAVRVGQMPLTYDLESYVSYTQQLAVERSMLHELLVSGTAGDDYVQGVQLRYETETLPFRWNVMFDDGAGSRNTNFQDGGGGLPLLGLGTEHWAVNGRFEWKFAGTWKDHYDFNAFASKHDLLVIGAGFDYEDANNISALFHTVDVDWKPASIKGLSVYAAYVGVARDYRNIATTGSVTDRPYDWGFLVQAGYFLNPQWEVFARYDLANLDRNAPTGTGTLGAAARIENHVHEITAGVNYFIYSHSLKLTVDGTWLPNGSPVSLDGTGILGQTNNKDQFLLRGQFQFLF